TCMTESTDPDVILEPGDPGYVDPANAAVPVEDPANSPPPSTEPVPAGADLQHVRQAGESDAEFMSRIRNTVVVSESPTDIVPNRPQISRGPRAPVEGQEGLETGSEPEPGPEPEPVEPTLDQPAEEEPPAEPVA